MSRIRTLRIKNPKTGIIESIPMDVTPTTQECRSSFFRNSKLFA